jgi:hypothetical protein
MARKNHTKEQQERRIIHLFAEWIKMHRREVWATSYEIARGLDMTPQSPFRKILNGMVDSGVLVSRKAHRPGRWQAVEYTLRPGTYRLPSPHMVNLKVRGKQEGQLELW